MVQDFAKISRVAPEGVTATVTQGNFYVEWTMSTVNEGIEETIMFDIYYIRHYIVSAKRVGATKGTVSGYADWALICNNVKVHQLD
ncbi:uncharacterized protein L969DRAFT_50129 [Mixia osmundae IAM 14324]|uniref:Uncharacterized protein n=1 Tax=Mixia osmundae (strain CBS 9802 / IAM 14324 / JCM 22182 / KY 12970) TaxID=764103 RepID=G7E1Z6_MIXOS|nr:uncharacterized protein L969DRAFT_50129 [Mixia osmundae IAM 14324]KEI38708.1 hypothetical protein L969DRAFT_50129 [Mixia osmundae IAM 14324]GAA96833.1 hypothetical protein E5Q_03506 [Mixia osmundae IAM 14324]